MTTRQFDGPTLEAALAKVRKELGADARITGAEKVRQGGIGGFFSRERVEVSVEIGRTRMTLGEALALGPGSVIGLHRLAEKAYGDEKIIGALFNVKVKHAAPLSTAGINKHG